MTTTEQLPSILDDLQAIYDVSVANLRAGLAAYLKDGVRPSADFRASGAFAYPELRVHYAPRGPAPRVGRAFALIRNPGEYAVTVTRPALFRDYLIEQLEYLVRDYGVSVSVRRSVQEIPYPYILDGAEDLRLDGAETEEIARWFPATQLAYIGDEVVDGVWAPQLEAARPLGLFDAPRVDYSLARLKHYTGTPVEHVQDYVLFTNYTRYVDEFVRWGMAQIKAGGRYTELSLAGYVSITRDTPDPDRVVAEAAWRKHQMPAYHLIAEGGQGITLVNIGVGPSNAKTITDHLAVLRPQAWLMIGHCGGLRPSQTIGDYVLAHAYLRDDHVLDDVLPVEIPIPPIAEVQQALYRAAEIVSGETGEVLKRRLRTGTIVTTDDRTGSCATPPPPCASTSPARRDRHGVRHHRRSRLSFPCALRHPAVRIGQAYSRGDQAAGAGQPLLRAGHLATSDDRGGGDRRAPSEKVCACIRASFAPSTSRRSGSRFRPQWRRPPVSADDHRRDDQPEDRERSGYAESIPSHPAVGRDEVQMVAVKIGHSLTPGPGWAPSR